MKKLAAAVLVFAFIGKLEASYKYIAVLQQTQLERRAMRRNAGCMAIGAALAGIGGIFYAESGNERGKADSAEKLARQYNAEHGGAHGNYSLQEIFGYYDRADEHYARSNLYKGVSYTTFAGGAAFLIKGAIGYFIAKRKYKTWLDTSIEPVPGGVKFALTRRF